jgi:hypothetical protein
MNMRTFSQFKKDTSAIFAAERAIIDDKLKQGIGGIEWLILHAGTSEKNIFKLNDYTETLELFTDAPLIDVFSDAFIMDRDSFYEKHEINWGISLKAAMTYFKLLKERDYERYFDTIQEICKKVNEGRA